MAMEAVRIEEVKYAQRMADQMDLDEGEELAGDEIRVRCSVAMKEMMEGLAEAETRARKLRNRAGKVSLNKLMKLVIERYAASWGVEHKVPVPKSKNDEEGVDRAARAINAVRAKKGRAKT
jgi:hypothetical protein